MKPASTCTPSGLAFRSPTLGGFSPMSFARKSVLSLPIIWSLLAISGAAVTGQQPAAIQSEQGQGVDSSLLTGLRWRSIGPARGGRSQTVAGTNKRPLEYYFGATGGGVWKTTDGGLTWRPVTDRFLNTSS